MRILFLAEQVFNWIKGFKEGREDLKDDPRERRPSTSINEETVDQIKTLVEKDRRLSIDTIANEVEISQGSAF